MAGSTATEGVFVDVLEKAVAGLDGVPAGVEPKSDGKVAVQVGIFHSRLNSLQLPPQATAQ